MSSPVLAITCGDPAGIGPELIKRALVDPACPGGFTPRILGEVPSSTIPGQPDERGSAVAIEALKQAVNGLRRGEFAAVVTAPIAKNRLHAAGFQFPGHTEFFAEAFAAEMSCAEPTMCLTGPSLTVALVTAHCALSEVPRLVTREGILRATRDLATHLRRRHGGVPRIAVAGLNPHAGEAGAFGREEIELIQPAIAAAQAEHRDQALIYGPFPPDTLFHRAVAGEFDGVVCLYHDQGLIPLKLLDFDCAVNITLGLPIVRTSPDHGTAFDIAGTGRAKHQSMLAAIQLAAELIQKPL